MKIESEATFENGERGSAIFEAVEVEGQIWLVLDKGRMGARGLDTPPVLFHPRQQAISPLSERGLAYLHTGTAIPLEKYLRLPNERQGFFRNG